MIICNETIDILRNFSEINQSLLFKSGNVLKTVNEQTNVLARAEVAETFPCEFAIYDLNKFLGVLSLFDGPALQFHENSVSITSTNDTQYSRAGQQIAEYQFASKTLFSEEEKILEKDIKLPSIDVEFDIKEHQLIQILKATSIMSLPEMAVVADGNNILLKAVDTKTSIDSYSVIIGETTEHFKMIFKIQNLKMMKGSYHLQISEKGLGHFKNLDRNLEYWIATEIAA